MIGNKSQINACYKGNEFTDRVDLGALSGKSPGCSAGIRMRLQSVRIAPNFGNQGAWARSCVFAEINFGENFRNYETAGVL